MINILTSSQLVSCNVKQKLQMASRTQMEPVVVVQDGAHFPNAPP